MVATFDQATDDIFSLFNTAWTTGSAAIVGSVPFIYWPGLEIEENPETDKYFVIVSKKTVFEEQKTLSGNLDGLGTRRYNNRGFIMFSINAPVSDPEGYRKATLLGMLTRDAYRGKETSSAIWFRNCRVEEGVSTGRFNVINVVIEYEYDDLG